MSHFQSQDNERDAFGYEEDVQFEDLDAPGTYHFKRWQRLLRRLFTRKLAQYWLIGGIIVSLACLLLVLVPSLSFPPASSPTNTELDAFSYSDSKPASSFSFIQVFTPQYIYIEHLGTKEQSEIRAIRRSNGTIVWRFPIHVPLMSQPVVAGNIFYIHIYDGHVSSLYALSASKGMLLWKYVLPKSFTSFSLPVTVVNGIVYDPSLLGDVIALQAQTGKYIWSYRQSGQLTINDIQFNFIDNVAYLSSVEMHQIIALDALSGSLLWHTTGSLSFVAVRSGIMYLNDQKNILYALQLRTGDTLWKSSAPLLQGQYAIGPDDLLGYAEADGSIEVLHVKMASVVWRSKSLGLQATILRMNNNHLYVVDSNISQHWVLASLDPSTGNVLWRYSGSAFIQIKGIGNYVYAKSADNQIYVLQAETGKLLWSSPLGKSLSNGLDDASGTASEPTFQIVNNEVFITTLGENNDALTVLDNSDGHILWQRISIIGVPSLLANYAYLTGVDGILYEYAGDSGKLIWSTH